MGRANRYDAIVAGEGRNGLSTAACLARAGLCVVAPERSDRVGGAAVSREVRPGRTFSSCSYGASPLRPEIARDRDLPAHGLQAIPCPGGASLTADGGRFAHRRDARAREREIARRAPRDAEGCERFRLAALGQRRFVRPLLLRTPPDPASLAPRDLGGRLFLLRRLHGLGAREADETLRFRTASVGDRLDENPRDPPIKAHLAGSGIVGTGLGLRSPGRFSRSFR